MLWFFLFIAWIWLLIAIVTDIFRSDDLSGFTKALWILFVIIVPWLGALIYLIARGGSMQERAMRTRPSARRLSGSTSRRSRRPAERPRHELTKLAQLRDSGVITADEFEAQKAKLLA